MASIKGLVDIRKQFIFLPAYLIIAYWTKDCSNHEDLWSVRAPSYWKIVLFYQL